MAGQLGFYCGFKLHIGTCHLRGRDPSINCIQKIRWQDIDSKNVKMIAKQGVTYRKKCRDTDLLPLN